MRHQNLPQNWATWLAINETLKLVQEPTNAYDPHAVAIYTHGGRSLDMFRLFIVRPSFPC